MGVLRGVMVVRLVAGRHVMRRVSRRAQTNRFAVRTRTITPVMTPVTTIASRAEVRSHRAQTGKRDQTPRQHPQPAGWAEPVEGALDEGPIRVAFGRACRADARSLFRLQAHPLPPRPRGDCPRPALDHGTRGSIVAASATRHDDPCAARPSASARPIRWMVSTKGS
jgi:hypothetical protein